MSSDTAKQRKTLSQGRQQLQGDTDATCVRHGLAIVSGLQTTGVVHLSERPARQQYKLARRTKQRVSTVLPGSTRHSSVQSPPAADYHPSLSSSRQLYSPLSHTSSSSSYSRSSLLQVGGEEEEEDSVDINSLLDIDANLSGHRSPVDTDHTHCSSGSSTDVTRPDADTTRLGSSIRLVSTPTEHTSLFSQSPPLPSPSPSPSPSLQHDTRNEWTSAVEEEEKEEVCKDEQRTPLTSTPACTGDPVPTQSIAVSVCMCTFCSVCVCVCVCACVRVCVCRSIWRSVRVLCY